MPVTNKIRTLLDAAERAYDAQLSDTDGQASVTRAFGALKGALSPREQPPERLPTCRHLAQVADPQAMPAGPLRDVIEAFNAVEPHLRWRKRSGDRTNANAAFEEDHALSMIVGPGGLVPHDQVYFGVNLQGPGVRYPDHTHPPEETYLVLSDGEFSQDGVTWFTPGIGGTFYNPPGILHAMRAGDAPLFAMWVLWRDATQAKLATR
ncbi:MAG: dimethylsulfonioproprionate lyase family protein [Roseovarius sp.]